MKKFIISLLVFFILVIFIPAETQNFIDCLSSNYLSGLIIVPLSCKAAATTKAATTKAATTKAATTKAATTKAAATKAATTKDTRKSYYCIDVYGDCFSYDGDCSVNWSQSNVKWRPKVLQRMNELEKIDKNCWKEIL